MRGLELREIDHRMEARVDAGDVVALDEVVGVVLPVAVHLELGLAHLGEGLDRIVFHRLRQAAEGVDQRRRARIEVREHQSAPGLDPDRHQAVVFLPEPVRLAEIRRALQVAGGIEHPAVIAAAQHAAMAVPVVQQLRGAMRAHVVEAAQAAVAIADYKEPIARYFGCGVVAGVGQVARRTDQLPFAREDLAAFRLVDVALPIPARRQSMDAAAPTRSGFLSWRSISAIAAGHCGCGSDGAGADAKTQERAETCSHAQ